MSEIETVVVVDKVAKLAQLKAARAKLAQEAQEVETKLSVDQQIEHESRELALEQALHEAKEKYNDPLGKKLAVVRTDLGGIILKRPNHVLFRRFQDSGESTTEEFEKLVRPCRVFPATDGELSTMFDEQPAILSRCANAVCVLAGVKLKELAGK